MSKSASLQCIFLEQERSQCQLIKNAAAIFNYANEEFCRVRKAVPPSIICKLLLMKMWSKFYGPTMYNFGGDAEIMSGC